MPECHNPPVEPSFVRTLFDYSYWAWSRLFAAAAHLNHDAYGRPNGFTYGSLRGILLHSLWAEELWLSRWQGSGQVQEPSEAEVPTLETLVERWKGVEAGMRTFIEGLTPEKLRAPVTYRSTRTDHVYTDPLWQLMVHVANHATQHRSEAAEALTIAGHSPGDLDLLDYFREQRAER
jgi:uncharacterized damage-inducible protein DinB